MSEKIHIKIEYFIILFYITTLYSIYLLEPLFHGIGDKFGLVKYVIEIFIIIEGLLLFIFKRKSNTDNEFVWIKRIFIVFLIYMNISLFLNFISLNFYLLYIRQYLLPILLFYNIVYIGKNYPQLKSFFYYTIIFISINIFLGLITFFSRQGHWDYFAGAIGTGPLVIYGVFFSGISVNNREYSYKFVVPLIILLIFILSEVRVGFFLIPLFLTINYLINGYIRKRLYKLLLILFISIGLFFISFDMLSIISKKTQIDYGIIYNYDDLMNRLSNENADRGSRYFLGDYYVIINQEREFDQLFFGSGGGTTSYFNSISGAHDNYFINGLSFRSQIMTIFYEYGLLGVLLYLLFCYSLFKYSSTKIKNNKIDIYRLNNLEYSFILTFPPFIISMVLLLLYHNIHIIFQYSFFIAMYFAIFYLIIQRIEK